jgi:hypothetical protein
MTTITHDGLHFEDIRLTAAETAAGLSAARQAFASAGVSARACYDAMAAHANGEPCDRQLVAVWHDAERAAIGVATAGWLSVPDSAGLALG